MKYTNMLNNLGKIAWKSLHVFLILISFGLVGSIAALSIWMENLILAVIMMPPMIVFLGLTLNYGMELIAGGELYNTGIVHEGNSLIGIKKGPGYYKRKKYVDFFQVFLFVAYIVYFAFNISVEPGWAIGGIILFSICAVLYFIVGLSSIEKN